MRSNKQHNGFKWFGFWPAPIAPSFNQNKSWFLSFFSFSSQSRWYHKNAKSRSSHRRSPLDRTALIVIHQRAPPMPAYSSPSSVALSSNARLWLSHCLWLSQAPFIVLVLLFVHRSRFRENNSRRRTILLLKLNYWTISWLVFKEAIMIRPCILIHSWSVMARQLDRSCFHLPGNRCSHFARDMR